MWSVGWKAERRRDLFAKGKRKVQWMLSQLINLFLWAGERNDVQKVSARVANAFSDQQDRL
jgi:hypothetical protein